MTAVPPSATRAPNLLTSMILRDRVSSTNLELLRLQTQLSSGLRVNTPSDDPVAASLISTLNNRLALSDRRQRNIDHAVASLSALDQALANSNDLALRAREIASSQVGATADRESRASQATVVDSIIRELQAIANERYTDLSLFAGTTTGVTPIEGFFEGFRYAGKGGGLQTDVGSGLATPITMGADEAFGSLSARIEGDVDLDPALTLTTKLADLGGGRGRGVTSGTVAISVNGGANFTVDLSGTESVGDALDAIESAIRAANPGALAGAYPGGTGINGAGNALALNVNAGFTVDIMDLGGGTTAADLGLTGVTFDNVTPTDPAADLAPRVTGSTTFADLGIAGAAIPGDIVFENSGRTGTVSVTGAMTITEFAQSVRDLQLGLRVEINDAGDGVNVFNEVSGMRMSIAESGGGTATAEALGIRTFQTSTALSILNDGRGVEIADGVLDPVSGTATAALNDDFEVTLTDGTTFTVDLTAADIADVGSLLAKINADAALGGVAVPGTFEARLADGPNGIVFVDNSGGGGTTTVASLNGRAAEDLGLLDATFTGGGPATLAAEDRATVRVDSVFTALIELRDALLSDDTTGITLAGEQIEAAIDRLSIARGTAGGRTQRLEAARRREEDSTLLNEGVRSGLRDLDFVDATSRFTLLELAQQAGLQTAARAQSLSLLDFLG